MVSKLQQIARSKVSIGVCVKFTYGKSVTEVVKSVSHDHHPRERGHTSLLEVL